MSSSSSSSSSSDPSLLKKPVRSSAAIYMYVTETESMIKFLPFSFFKQNAKPLDVNPHKSIIKFLPLFAN